MEIEEALELYNITCIKYVLVRHNENKTYHIIDSNDNEYLLRIHECKENFSLDFLFNKSKEYEKIQNELNTIIAMRNNGLFLQKPILTKSHELVGKLNNGHFVSVLTWVDGSDLGNDYKEYLHEIGKMMALLHKSSSGINEFSIYYDCDLVKKIIEVFSIDCLNKKISEENFLLLSNTLKEINCVMNKLKMIKNHFGYIHSDLSFSNIIKTNNGIMPIDFSLGGFGFYEQEVGMMLGNISSIEERRIIVREYEKNMNISLSCHDVDAFFCFSIILYIVLQKEILYKEENFCKRIDKWYSNYFSKLIEKTNFSF